MKPDFKKLCVAIYDFENCINDCCKNICSIKDITEILDLHFNDVITNHRHYDLSEWKWQLINTIATPKMHIDKEINSLIFDLENSLLSIHNSNWVAVIQMFINEYYKLWHCPKGYETHIIEIDNEFAPYTKNKKAPNLSEFQWIVYGIAMNYTTKKVFIAVNNLVLKFSIDIPVELQQTINSLRGAHTFKETPQAPQLPPELSTPEATGYFEKAIESELMDSNYKWLKSKVLLACFAKEMSDRLKLGKGCTGDGVPRVNWKIFENLFGISNLRGALNDLKKTGADPLDINLVNDIFK